MVKKKGNRAKSKQSNPSKSNPISQIAQLTAIVKKIQIQQEEILANQRKQFTKIEKSEAKIEEDLLEAGEMGPALNEKQELEEFKKLENDLKKETQLSPLKRITAKDVSKGIVGAFIAIVNQFAFASGFQIAEHYSYAQSALLLITSFFIIVLFIYYTGFRKVDDKFVFKFLPIRAGVLYLVSILISILVPFAFRTLTFDMPFQVIFGTVASISVLAVLGAGAADLIGKA